MSQSSERNPAVVLQAPLKASLSSDYLPVPNLASYPTDYVLLRIAYTGVCGSDVHFYLHGGVGGDKLKYVQSYTGQAGHHTPDGGSSDAVDGLVMGHEATATIHEIGSAVTNFTVGDKVAVEPGIPCRQCKVCADGKYNFCPDMRFAASFYIENDNGKQLIHTTAGTLSKYYVLPASLCYKLPKHVSLQEGILVEPLSVAVHAVRLGKVSLETDTVVVMGAGTVGLLCAAASLAYGARKVVIVDISTDKLNFAAKWLSGPESATRLSSGMLMIYQSDILKGAEENATQLRELFSLPKAGADVVLECSGAASSTSAGIFLLRQDGHMVQTGLSKKPFIDEFPIVELSEREIHLHGAFRYNSGDFAMARNLLERGAIQNIGALISNIFAFEDFESAWKATRDGKGIKNIIQGVQD